MLVVGDLDRSWLLYPPSLRLFGWIVGSDGLSCRLQQHTRPVRAERCCRPPPPPSLAHYNQCRSRIPYSCRMLAEKTQNPCLVCVCYAFAPCARTGRVGTHPPLRHAAAVWHLVYCLPLEGHGGLLVVSLLVGEQQQGFTLYSPFLLKLPSPTRAPQCGGLQDGLACIPPPRAPPSLPQHGNCPCLCAAAVTQGVWYGPAGQSHSPDSLPPLLLLPGRGCVAGQARQDGSVRSACMHLHGGGRDQPCSAPFHSLMLMMVVRPEQGMHAGHARAMRPQEAGPADAVQPSPRQ